MKVIFIIGAVVSFISLLSWMGMRRRYNGKNPRCNKILEREASINRITFDEQLERWRVENKGNIRNDLKWFFGGVALMAVSLLIIYGYPYVESWKIGRATNSYNSSTSFEEEMKAAIQSNVQKQLDEYIPDFNRFGVKDVSIELEYSSFSISHPDKFCSYGLVSYKVKDYLVSPDLDKIMENGQFSEGFLEFLSDIDIDYSFDYDETYSFSGYSKFVYNMVKTAIGDIYTITDGMVLKNETIYFIAEETDLTADVKVGDIISDSFHDTEEPSKVKCQWCDGDGKTHDTSGYGAMHGDGHYCWHCGGDGWIDEND